MKIPDSMTINGAVVLAALSRQHNRVSALQLAEISEKPHMTVYGILMRSKDLGYVQRHSTWPTTWSILPAGAIFIKELKDLL